MLSVNFFLQAAPQILPNLIAAFYFVARMRLRLTE